MDSRRLIETLLFLGYNQYLQSLREIERQALTVGTEPMTFSSLGKNHIQNVGLAGAAGGG